MVYVDQISLWQLASSSAPVADRADVPWDAISETFKMPRIAIAQSSDMRSTLAPRLINSDAMPWQRSDKSLRRERLARVKAAEARPKGGKP